MPRAYSLHLKLYRRWQSFSCMSILYDRDQKHPSPCTYNLRDSVLLFEGLICVTWSDQVGQRLPKESGSKTMYSEQVQCLCFGFSWVTSVLYILQQILPANYKKWLMKIMSSYFSSSTLYPLTKTHFNQWPILLRNISFYFDDIQQRFQIQRVISWQHIRQPIKRRVRDGLLLINRYFNMDLFGNLSARYGKVVYQTCGDMLYT